MNVRFGIVGFGFMGPIHLKMISETDGAAVTAVCDIDPEPLAAAPAGIRTYTDATELFRDGNVDVAVISANNDQHKQLVLAAAAAGKHVLCEKPVALSLADLDEMAAACNAAGVTFTVHQQRRFDADFRTTKAVFDSGTLGDVYTVKSSLYGFNGNMHDWHIYPEQGGGMLYDWGVHLLDQLLWMIPGAITTVFADVRNVINKDVDDYFNVLLRFACGVMAELELGTYYLSDKPNWFQRHWYIGGNAGCMYVDGFSGSMASLGCESAIVRTSELLTSAPDGKRSMSAMGPTRSFGPPPEGRIVTEPVEAVNTTHKDYYINYLKALRGEEPPLVTIPEVRRVLRLMDAIRESAATGRSVDFE